MLRDAIVVGALALAACKADAPAASSPGPGPAVPAPLRDAAAAVAVDAVSSASPAWEAGPAVVVAASDARVDGAALRARHRARITADTSPVTVLTGGTALALGQELCEAVVPARPAETPILLKPNLGGFNWFRDPKKHAGDNGVTGRTTDPEFVRGVVRCLKARGHTRITIADGFTGKAADWVRLARVSGYEAMAKAEGVSLVALDDDGVFDVEGTQPGKPLGISGIEKTSVPTLLMPKLLAETLTGGLYISLPKLKAHRFSVFSIAIKGGQGAVMYSDAAPAFRQKWRTHEELDKVLAMIKASDPKARTAYVKALETFAERMVDILELEAPDVVLAEGAPAMTGDGFVKLVPREPHVAIGGTNPILVDRVGAELLGFWDNAALAAELGGHRTSPLLTAAARRFGVDLARPKLAGNGAALVAAAKPGNLVAMAGFEIGGEPPGPVVDPATIATELVAPRVATPPVIDGALDDAAWTTATPLVFSTDWAGRLAPVKTSVRAVWSPAGLHVAWELENVVPFTDRKHPVDVERIDLYEENCVELFVAPDPLNPKRYFELEVGPHGHFFDLLVDFTRRPRGDASWSGQLRIATRRDEPNQRVTIELAVEAPDVLAALTPGARLPLALYRMEGAKPRRYLAAFPTRTPRPSFHVPEAFGTLVLAPAPAPP